MKVIASSGGRRWQGGEVWRQDTPLLDSTVRLTDVLENSTPSSDTSVPLSFQWCIQWCPARAPKSAYQNNLGFQQGQHKPPPEQAKWFRAI